MEEAKRIPTKWCIIALVVLLLLGTSIWVYRPVEIDLVQKGTLHIWFHEHISSGSGLHTVFADYRIPPNAPAYEPLKELLGGIQLRKTPFTGNTVSGQPYGFGYLWIDAPIFSLNRAADEALIDERYTVTSWAGLSREEWFTQLDALLEQSQEYKNLPS